LEPVIEEYNTKVRECMRFNGKAKAKETLILRLRFDEFWKKISQLKFELDEDKNQLKINA
jgi:hypothetical protein